MSWLGRGSQGGGREREWVLGGAEAQSSLLHLYEDSIMKGTKHCLEKEGRERGQGHIMQDELVQRTL
jgi:hypothetical protein